MNMSRIKRGACECNRHPRFSIAFVLETVDDSTKGLLDCVGGSAMVLRTSKTKERKLPFYNLVLQVCEGI